MIYLDAAATTPPFEEAVSLYEDLSLHHFGNSNSLHGYGFDAHKQNESAREKVLSLLKLSGTHKLIFTSGATESNNTAIKAIALQFQNRGKTIITSSVEHPSVLQAMRQLASRFGFHLIELPVNEKGYVEPPTLQEAMSNDVILVSIMGVNNETGAIFPLAELADIAHSNKKCLFHSDLTQGIGKVDFPLSKIDLISFSAHKFGGLKGSGALVYKKSLRVEGLLSGGSQEDGLRPGTVDVGKNVALSVALEKTLSCQKETHAHFLLLKSTLLRGLSSMEEVALNSYEGCNPSIVNFSLSRHKASVVIEALSRRGIYVSSVSACSSKGEPISYVLLAMKKPERLAANSMRVSFLPSTSVDEVNAFVNALNEILQEVRPL